ncbi:MAG: hypothetical protein FD170_3616 [Bacteroidetes bacterium]|nr:MAG: hypothetical protein FD170_3616 [Bacteroidota bacterium]
MKNYPKKTSSNNLDSLGNEKVFPLDQFIEPNGDTLINSNPGRF